MLVAVVFLDTVVMERYAQTLMNAAPLFTIAVTLNIAKLPSVLITVVVLLRLYSHFARTAVVYGCQKPRF